MLNIFIILQDSIMAINIKENDKFTLDSNIDPFLMRFRPLDFESKYIKYRQNESQMKGESFAFGIFSYGLLSLRMFYYLLYELIQNDEMEYKVLFITLSILQIIIVLYEVIIFIIRRMKSAQGIIIIIFFLVFTLIQNYYKNLINEESNRTVIDFSVIIIIVSIISFEILFNYTFLQNILIWISLDIIIIIFIIFSNYNYVEKVIDAFCIVMVSICINFTFRKIEYYFRKSFFNDQALISTNNNNNDKNNKIDNNFNILSNFPDPIIISNKGAIIFSNNAYYNIGQDQDESDFFHSKSENLQDDSKSILSTPETIADKIKSNNSEENLNNYIKNSKEILEPSQFSYEDLNRKKEISSFQIVSFHEIINSEHFIIYYLRGRNYYDKFQESQAKEKYFNMFISSITHDFRSPLNIILGNLDVISFKGNLDRDQLDYLRHMKTATSQMILLVQDILDYSTMKSSKLSLSISPFEFEIDVYEIIDLFRDKYEDKALYIKYQNKTSIPRTIVSDGGRLKQILTNLITNAYKFTERGGVTILSEYVEENSILRLTIEDTGIGIDENDIPKLFKPFGKLNDTHKLNPNGIGLGLHICKEILELLGGGIKVESEINVGSKFIIWIKNQSMRADFNNRIDSQLVKSSEFSSESEIRLVKNPRPRKVSIFKVKSSFSSIKNRLDCNCPKILIVDDDVSNRFVLANYCKKVAVRFDEAKDGAEAVEKVTNYQSSINCCTNYKIIFMDYNMPKMNGDEAAIEIKKYVKETFGIDIVIIGLSGNNLEEGVFRSITGSKLFETIVEKPLIFEKFKYVLYSYI